MAREFKVPEGMPQLNPAKVPDRLTINLTMHHEHSGDSPHSIQSIMWGYLETSDQTWSRRGEIGEAPEPIPLGWFSDMSQIGYVVVENLEGKNEQLRPSKEQQAETAGRVIQIGADSGLQLLVRPGWPQQFLPAELTGLTMRCRSGIARYRLTLFPK